MAKRIKPKSPPKRARAAHPKAPPQAGSAKATKPSAKATKPSAKATKPSAKATKPSAKAARPNAARGILGNDPFLRGAAPSAPSTAPLAEHPASPTRADTERPVTRPLRRPGPAPKPRPPTQPGVPTVTVAAARPKTAPKPAAKPTARPGTAGARAPTVIYGQPARPSSRSRTVPTQTAKPATRHAPAPETTPSDPRAPTVHYGQSPFASTTADTSSPRTIIEGALVRHVHVPEVDVPETARPTDPPEPIGGTLDLVAQLARSQVQALIGRAVRSPATLELAAAAISGATAVRALAARPAEPRAVDAFGEDPSAVARTAPALDFLFRHYFRVQVQGAEHLPARGPVLSIANHAGALPLDGPVLRTALERARPNTHARWLVEDALFNAPFLGTWLNRLGAVRACPENAERLLVGNASLAVFPEGVNALTKTFRRRYHLQRFGRGGFVKLALRTGAALVPTVIVGAEEATPVLATLSLPSLGLPVLPLTPSLIPLPVRWTVAFLPPIDLSGRGPADAHDLALVQQVTEEVRTRIHQASERIRAERKSVLRG